MSSEKKPEQISLDLSSDISSSSTPDDGNTLEKSHVLEWVSHPAMRNMRITAVVTLFLLVLVVIVYALTQSVFFTVLAFVILYASLAAFYFPTRYRLDDEGVEIKTTTQTLRKRWSQYRSFYPDKNGVLLSPFVRPTRLENFRGVYIRFGNNREDVTSFISQRITKRPLDEGKDGTK